MGKPLMLMESDDHTIEQLKKRMGAKTKVEVVRAALAMLSDEVEKQERIKRWKRAADAAKESSLEVMRDFQPGSRLKNVP
jgi:hypothetical protein